MHCFLRGAPLSAHSNCGGKAFQCIPDRRRRKRRTPKKKKKTPNAQRRTPNIEPERERTNVCRHTVSTFFNSTLGAGRSAFGVFLIPRLSLLRRRRPGA